MTTSLLLTVRPLDGNHTEILVAGELVTTTSQTLRDQAKAEIDGGCTRLVLDMSGVSFCDSSGLSAVIDVWLQTRAVGGSLALTGVPDRLGRLLRIANTDTLIEISYASDDGPPPTAPRAVESP
ncbi:anti-sigma B factor antagonist [Saccharothrix tamanrassetensis]|uniref:Anti-sigma factor antagonist n=1 Tax=Saccharothrix tamanrassetensis TaxID=1051531 RepID=A0A841CWE0_9PSEU|nr:STAS domain-containing protein [Saccharothrix tamanrassetensis]MBB5960438.1 anti-sigma B factor antagonist [Saccharothrix tamanrassetensis]